MVSVARRLTLAKDLSKQIEITRQFVVRELAAPKFYIGLFDPETNNLNFIEDFEFGNQMEQEIISLENREDWGLSGYVIKNREKLEWFTEKQKKSRML